VRALSLFYSDSYIQYRSAHADINRQSGQKIKRARLKFLYRSGQCGPLAFYESSVERSQGGFGRLIQHFEQRFNEIKGSRFKLFF
jgi:hypothetical protein